MKAAAAFDTEREGEAEEEEADDARVMVPSR